MLCLSYSFDHLSLVLNSFILLFVSPVLALKSSSSNSREHDLRRNFHHFFTRPDIDAPAWDVDIKDESKLTSGLWFVALYTEFDQMRQGPGWNGPLIYDGRGDLVWSGVAALNHYNTFDFRPAEIAGKQRLIMIAQNERAAVILNDHYELESSVPIADHQSHMDVHELQITDAGQRALTIAVNLARATVDASATIGFQGQCNALHAGFRELDLMSLDNHPKFEWSTEDHIGLNEITFSSGSVYNECINGWDHLHLNSVDKFPDGDYLLSSRHTDTIYKISHLDGSIIWRLGGLMNDFKMLNGVTFSRQHHARVQSHNETHTTISLFDNAVGTGPEEIASNAQSRGLVLSLCTNRSGDAEMTAEMTAEFLHPQGTFTNSRGSFQLLPSGNAFVGWTYSSRITEYTSDGTQILDASLRVPAHTYRAYKLPWTGLPKMPPDVLSQAVLTRVGRATVIYVSWNGATEVVAWSVLEWSADNNTTHRITSMEKCGFETTIRCKGHVPAVIIEAFDAAGNVLGRSNVIQTSPLSKDLIENPLNNSSQFPAELGVWNPVSTQPKRIVTELIWPLWIFTIYPLWRLRYCLRFRAH